MPPKLPPHPQERVLFLIQKNALAVRVFARQLSGKIVRRKSSESELLAKNLADMGEDAAKTWRFFAPILVLQFPGKVGARDFTKNPRQISRAQKQIFFTARLWELGAPKIVSRQFLPRRRQIFSPGPLGAANRWQFESLSVPLQRPTTARLAILFRATPTKAR